MVAHLRKEWTGLPRWARWVLAAYLIGFADGTAAHVRALAQGGIHAYSAFSQVPFQVFFVCLVVLDPLVVVLAGFVQRAGIWLAAAVMALDMAANEGTWRTTTRWPVAGTRTRRLYLGSGRALTWQRPSSTGAGPSSDLLRLNPTAGTGPLNRWNTNLTGDPVSYPNRAAVDRKLPAYTSAPLRRATRVTGLGRVNLDVTGIRGASHGALHAYLEDVAPSGRVTYVTEGELALADRAIAPRQDNPAWRKLRTPRTYASSSAAPFPQDRPQQVTFDLLPTSVLFRAGDRIRITIAAADPDAFALLPADGKATYRIGHSAANPSYAELPVVS